MFVVLFALSVFSAAAQHETIPATESFSIEGKVKRGLAVSISDLSAYKSHSIDSIVITNHLGVEKAT